MTKQPRWLNAFKVASPLCLSYIPIGLACGIVLHAAGFNTLLIILISMLVFSGGAQFLIASMLTANAPMHTILIMLFFLELRYALLGSSLSQYFQTMSNKFIYFFAISLNDENYAINYLKFVTDKSWTPHDAIIVEHYSLFFWTVSNFFGSAISQMIPKINIDIVNFALTSLFIYMVVMQVHNKLTILISFISGVLAVIFMCMWKSTMGLVFATLVASLIGFFIENNLHKHGKDRGFLLKKIKPNKQ